MAGPLIFGAATQAPPPSGDQATNVMSGTFSAVGPGQSLVVTGPMNVWIYASINTSLATTNASSSATLGSASGLAVGASINSVNVPYGTTIGALSGTTATLAFPTVERHGFFSAATTTVSNVDATQYLLGATVTTTSQSGVVLPANTTVASIVTASVTPTSNNPAGSPGATGVIKLSSAPTSVNPSPKNGRNLFFATVTNNSVTTGTDSGALFVGAGVSYSGQVQLERSFDGGKTWIVCNIGGSGTLAQYPSTAGTGYPVSLTFGEPERVMLYRLNCISYTSGVINYRLSTTGAAALSLSVNQLS